MGIYNHPREHSPISGRVTKQNGLKQVKSLHLGWNVFFGLSNELSLVGGLVVTEMERVKRVKLSVKVHKRGSEAKSLGRTYKRHRPLAGQVRAHWGCSTGPGCQ